MRINSHNCRWLKCSRITNKKTLIEPEITMRTILTKMIYGLGFYPWRRRKITFLEVWDTCMSSRLNTCWDIGSSIHSVNSLVHGALIHQVSVHFTLHMDSGYTALRKTLGPVKKYRVGVRTLCFGCIHIVMRTLIKKIGGQANDTTTPSIMENCPGQMESLKIQR